MKYLKYLFTFLLFVVILIEEAFWEIFAAVSAFFARFRLIQKLESFIAARSPAVCLTLFLIPVILMLPFKLAGVWLIAHGHTLDGLFVFVAAKASATFLAARLFALTQNKLMSIAWFARVYTKFIAWKDSIKNYIHATASYQIYHAWRIKLNAKVAAIFKRGK